VRRNAKRRGKKPAETLLDRSLHHAAMKGLPNSQKRGRPDIVHFCLLEALGAPLNRERGLRVWVHTIGGYAIEVAPEAKLPRDCSRFNSLMEQLFVEGRVPPKGEKPLLSLSPGQMEDETLSLADEAISIYPEALEAWVVASRLIYEFERARAYLPRMKKGREIL